MALPRTMKGVQLTGHGGTDRLVWNDEIPIPALGPQEVLVRVLAAGVNNTDINTRIGWYASEVTAGTGEADASGTTTAGGWAGALRFPLIQGGDLCGEVAAVGAAVETLHPGMRVTCPLNQPMPTPEEPMRFAALGSDRDGAFAQYCVVPADQLHDVSASPLSDVEIAATPCAHGTALNLLTRANVGPGDAVLVTGASGGVGLAAVALARLLGAEVTAMAGRDKHDAVRAAGAAHLLEREAVPPPRRFTVVIDVVGRPGFADRLRALAPGGRYAVSGAIGGPLVEVDLRTVYLNDLTLLGCTYTPRAVFEKLVAWVNAGKVRPLVSKTYPLRDIALAQAEFAAKTYPGKLVLIPPWP